MKISNLRRFTGVVAAFLLAASCSSGGGPAAPSGPAPTGGSTDPLPAALGEWSDCSLTASVVSGAATDQLYFAVDISSAGDFVVQFRDMAAPSTAADFWWTIPDLRASLSQGQEAADFVSVATPGRYSFLVRNGSATDAMSCEVRLVPLAETGWDVPGEGSAACPVRLTVNGAAHPGKIGYNDGVFDASYYYVDLAAAGTVTITAARTSVGNSVLCIGFYGVPGFDDLQCIAWDENNGSSSVLPITDEYHGLGRYYIKVWQYNASSRTEYDLSVSQ